MKITDKFAHQTDQTMFICDYSPPRTADPATLTPAQTLETDYICVATNPGRRVRVDSALFAHALKQHAGRDVVFNLAPRDMNKLALQSHLLGLQLIGLENVLVIYGDRFTEKDLTQVSKVRDWKPTELIQAIKQMNEGLDYKGGKLKYPTDFCVGAAIDLSRGIQKEATLTHRKQTAGADFFITQPVFNMAEMHTFQQAYGDIGGDSLPQPIFWGVQILQKDGIIFSSVPDSVRSQLDKGRDGVEIALEHVAQLTSSGIKTIYLIPPILRGGARNYAAAERVITAVRNA